MARIGAALMAQNAHRTVGFDDLRKLWFGLIFGIKYMVNSLRWD